MLTACSLNKNPTLKETQITTNGDNINMSNVPPIETTAKTLYTYIRFSWTLNDFEKLLNDANLIFIGEVNDVNFKFFDATTGNPPIEDSDESYVWLDSIYDIDVLKTYKGNTTNNVQLKIDVGLEGVKVEEQLAMLATRDRTEIQVADYSPLVKIGETYLFVLKNKAEHAFIIHPQQSTYSVKGPQAKRHGISAKDIIMTFGEDKWKEFLEIWG